MGEWTPQPRTLRCGCIYRDPSGAVLQCGGGWWGGQGGAFPAHGHPRPRTLNAASNPHTAIATIDGGNPRRPQRPGGQIAGPYSTWTPAAEGTGNDGCHRGHASGGGGRADRRGACGTWTPAAEDGGRDTGDDGRRGRGHADTWTPEAEDERVSLPHQLATGSPPRTSSA